MLIDELQSRVWWAEHKLRSLILGRGMRPGRAIKRVFGAGDDATHALAQLWAGDEFAGVEFGDTIELFERAYSDVRSCMQGHGRECHAAYTPHGVGLAVIRRADRIVARALVYPKGGIHVKAYGELAYALEALLQHVCGLRRGSLLEFFPESAFVVWGWKSVKREIEVPAVYRHIHTGRELAVGTVRFNLTPFNELELVRPGYAFTPRIVHERVEVFKPYVD